nr:hypothetical protein [Tanacetum cinerariifolium]
MNANPISYALTVNPTIYISCIKQFWTTAKAKTINEEGRLQALVDGKKIIITESTMRRDLQLEDAEGVDCLLNATIFEQLALIGYEQLSSLTESVADEAVYKELDDSLLKKKQRSRTHKLKRLYKVGLTARVESSDDNEDLGEDASKQGRISDINADEDITLVSTHDDEQMFDAAQDLGGEEVFVAKQDENVVEKEVGAAQVQVSTTDKGKAIMIEEPVKLKKKDQIMIDEKVALKLQAELQAEFDKEQRLAREKAQKEEEESNIASIESWDDVQRKAKEKTNKPPTQAQQRKIMCTYLKNIEGKKLTDLKNKYFDSIQKMFDRAFKRHQLGEIFSLQMREELIVYLMIPSFEQLALMRKPRRKVTEVPQPSDPIEHVADEDVYKELDDRLVRATTTASSLEAEQDSGNINKTQSKATPNESSSQGTDSGSGPKF